jgi:hypothetical protein
MACRSLGARYLEHVRLVAKPSLNFLQQFSGLDPERRRNPVAATHDVADEFRLLRAGRTEQHRLVVALHHVGNAGEIDRLVAGVEFADASQALDIAAQPEAIEVHRIRTWVRSGFFNDIHRRTPCLEL